MNELGQKQNKILLIISFIEGSAVMAVELLSAKMIAPYFGNSLYVWASVLAVTLAGLAVGYFIGGIVSKKYPDIKYLFFTILASSLLVMIMPSWGKTIMQLCMGNLSLQNATLFSTTMFLMPPLVCFGMVSPMIIDLVSRSGETAGKVSGTVYAVSTVGGIIMTILTGFYMIPELGLKTSTYIVATVLLLIPMWYFVIGKKSMAALGLLIVPMLLMAGSKSEWQVRENSRLKVQYISDGLMGQMLVIDDVQKQKRSLHVNNISQSFMHIPSRRSNWRYIHRIALYSSDLKAGSRALVCGIGGGSLVNELNVLGFNIDAVDLDERMGEVAKDYFFMSDKVNVSVDDARHYINTSNNKYDLIVLDMSAGENQPANVYTKECFTTLKTMLNEDGMLFLHYQNVMEGKHALAMKSLCKTFSDVGFETRIIDTEVDWGIVNERMILASHKDLGIENSKFERRDKFADPFKFPTGERIFINDFSFADGLILVDDKPIMDHLHVNTLSNTRLAAIKSQIPIFMEEELEFIH